MKIVNRILNQL